MKIASGKMSGKRLDSYLIQQLKENGVAEVAALSELGVGKIHLAGQRVANKTGMKLQADPRQDEVEVSDGKYQIALIVTFTKVA